MQIFEPLKSQNDIAEIISSAFDVGLDISGDWGYSMQEATIISSVDNPINVFEHTLASMRTYVQMNMTLPKDQRYGSINLNENSREEIVVDKQIYHKVTYQISAMREDEYASFIDEYKEGYGKDGFDLNGHFKRRKLATLTREDIYWFEVSQV